MNFNQVCKELTAVVEKLVINDPQTRHFNKTVEELKKVRKRFQIDTRSIPNGCWYSEDYLVIKRRYRRVLDYFGGFEYVDSEYITEAGDYVLYSTSSSRVYDFVDSLKQVDNSENEDYHEYDLIEEEDDL